MFGDGHDEQESRCHRMHCMSPLKDNMGGWLHHQGAAGTTLTMNDMLPLVQRQYFAVKAAGVAGFLF